MPVSIRPLAEYRAEEIAPLYEAAGWTAYTRPLLQNAYAHSFLTLAAYDGEDVVGVARVVGDGCSIAYVQDVLVLPSHRRRGVGTALMRETLCRCADVYQICLLTDDKPAATAFYQSLGLARDRDCGCVAFLRVRKSV